MVAVGDAAHIDEGHGEDGPETFGCFEEVGVAVGHSGNH